MIRTHRQHCRWRRWAHPIPHTRPASRMPPARAGGRGPASPLNADARSRLPKGGAPLRCDAAG
eukprot:scaffold24940_cov101-Isochrysis_galbana.AAC.1